MHQVYQPTGKKAMDEGMIEVKERHAYVVFFKTDESGFVPVGQVKKTSAQQARAVDRHACLLRVLLAWPSEVLYCVWRFVFPLTAPALFRTPV